jgi:protein-tyrosine phosphatase
LPSVLFVCTANQCRSPMAEVLFQQYLNRKGIAEDWRVESAGVWAMDGAPATANARKMMMDQGLSLTHHKSQSVRAKLIREFDLVLVMEDRHQEELRKNFPEVAHRVHLMTAMVDEARDVNDPVWGTIETYRVTADELEDLINRGFKRIQEMVSEVPE